MPSYGTGALADIFPRVETGHVWNDLKLRRDHINLQKLSSGRDINVMADIDSNKLHYECVRDGDFCEVKRSGYPKRQQDVDNEKLKEHFGAQVVDLEQCQDSSLTIVMDSNMLRYDRVEDNDLSHVMHADFRKSRNVENENLKGRIGTQLIDLEQCQDSSLRIIECVELSSATLMPSPKRLETSVKSVTCGSSETSLKMSFDFAAEMLVVDSCEVEPALEKGSLEDAEKKTEDDAAVGVEDTKSASKKRISGGKEVLVQGPPCPVITPDALCRQLSRQTDGKKISHAFRQVLDAEDATISDVEEPLPVRRTSQVEKTYMKRHRLNVGTELHLFERKSPQLFCGDLLVEKFHRWMRRGKFKDDEWILPWMLWPKHHRHKSGFSCI